MLERQVGLVYGRPGGYTYMVTWVATSLSLSDCKRSSSDELFGRRSSVAQLSIGHLSQTSSPKSRHQSVSSDRITAARQQSEQMGVEQHDVLVLFGGNSPMLHRPVVPARGMNLSPLQSRRPES